MIEINLVPDVKQELLKAQKVRTMVISGSIVLCLAAVGLVVLLALYVYGVQFARDVISQNAIDEKSKELGEVSDLSKMLTVQNQLSKVTEINDAKSVTSRTLDILPLLPQGVTVATFEAVNGPDGSKQITIEGQSSAGYASVELFQKVLTFTDLTYLPVAPSAEGETVERQTVPLASNVQVLETGYGKDSTGGLTLRYKLSFTIADELVSNSVKDVRFDTSRTGNVTDSYLNTPRNVFQDRPTELQEVQ